MMLCFGYGEQITASGHVDGIQDASQERLSRKALKIANKKN